MIPLVTTPQSLVHYSITSNPYVVFGLAHLIHDKTIGGRYYTTTLQHATSVLETYLILDNGVTENGSAMFIEDLYAVAQTVGASEIVLPDVYQDAPTTRSLVNEALGWLESKGHTTIACMAVVHDQFVTKLLKTLEEWSEYDQLSTLGIPKHQTVSENWMDGRLSILRLIESFGYRKRFKVHMLGVWNNIREVHQIAREFPWVHSIDTSWPIMAGLRNIRIDRHPILKIPYEAEPRLNSPLVSWETLVHNILVYERLAMGLD